MTNKINSLLAIFMALFVFSCSAEPVVDFTSKTPSVGDQDGYDKFFGNQREDIKDAVFKEQWGNVGVATTPVVNDLIGKYIITELGTSDTYISLYIRPLEAGAANADLNYASGNSVAKAREDSYNNEFFDPRKLLTDKKWGGDGVRIAWSGRAADPPLVEGAIIEPFSEYTGYDKYKLAAGSKGDYSIRGTWSVFTYVNKPNAGVVINTYVKSVNDTSTRAWFWNLPMPFGGAKPEHFSYLSESKNLGFGKGTKDDGNKEPRAKGTPSANLNMPGDDTFNNVNPPGKMLFGRKTGSGLDDVSYAGNTAVFLTTVVGYNIRTKTVSTEDLKLLDLPSDTTAKEFYMEFDADSYVDAKADGYDDQVNFPHWGDLNDKGDGFSIDGKGAKVIKFTGILLDYVEK